MITSYMMSLKMMSCNVFGPYVGLFTIVRNLKLQRQTTVYNSQCVPSTSMGNKL